MPSTNRVFFGALRGFAAAFGLACLATGAQPAEAIPVFAHRYGFTCQVCHTTVPHLTAFGESFLAHGYRIPGVNPKKTLPVAIKSELLYSSGAAGDTDESGHGRLPKAIVNEIELLVGGSAGKRTSYWGEIYAVDGGFPGRVRDLWVSQKITADDARVPISIRAGQSTLDLPVDPESFRETTDAYAIYQQNGFRNPFTLFAPKMGVTAELGSNVHGLSGSVALLYPHEAGSGLPAGRGMDRELYVQRPYGDFTVSAYRYDGTRPVAGEDDRFWRQGYGLGWAHGRTRVDAIYQNGFDARADQFRDGLFASGGFFQIRQDIGQRTFAIARWDGTQDNVFKRATIAGIGYRLRRNMRLSAFDTMTAGAANGGVTHTLTTQLLLAY